MLSLFDLPKKVTHQRIELGFFEFIYLIYRPFINSFLFNLENQIFNIKPSKLINYAVKRFFFFHSNAFSNLEMKEILVSGFFPSNSDQCRLTYKILQTK